MFKFHALPILTLTASSLMAGYVVAAPSIQDAAVLAAEVETFLRGQAQGYPGSVQITVEPPRITRQAACSQLQTFLSGGQRLRSRMTVGVRCVAPSDWTTYVQANLSIQGYYYVANRTIQVGDTLRLDHVTAREGDLLRLAPGAVFDPSLLVGHIAAQRLVAGGVIKSGALRSANSIQRGQTVRTEARGPGFVATGEGQALQAGGPGAQIQVKSTSGQIVSGTVMNSNTVQVLM